MYTIEGKLSEETRVNIGCEKCKYSNKTEKGIEKSKYIDRIVHRWYVNSFMEKYFIVQFISTSYACIKNKGMHKATLDLQRAMKKCKTKWNNYYILKMDIKKYFENINKEIMYKILERKIKDEKVLWLTKEIIYSSKEAKRYLAGHLGYIKIANTYTLEQKLFEK